MSSPSPAGSPPASSSAVHVVERESSIRFSHSTNTTSRSPLSRGWRDADESTPIRAADATIDRVYNTQPTSLFSPDTNSLKSSRRSDDGAAGAGAGPGPGAGAGAGAGAAEPKQPWYKGLAEKYGSVTLENKGSVARDHLALERTFLAWLRTSLAFASIGIAVTQLFRLNTSSARPTQSPPSSSFDTAAVLPYLSQAAAQAAASAATVAVSVQTLGPTLLDQLLGLPAADSTAPATGTVPVGEHTPAFDDDAARRLRHVGKPLGATFLLISILILLIGAHRYFESQYWIIRGKFPASRGSIFLVASIAGALIVASLVIVIVLAPTSYEKASSEIQSLQ